MNNAMIHAYLHSSYWAEGISLEMVLRSFDTFRCLVHKCVTDVFMLDAHQGQRIAALLLAVFSHAQVQGLRTRLLLTQDAHKLYEAFGFEVVASDVVMRRNSPHSYPRQKRKKETA